MIENDICIGKPLVAYSAAKATIEALAGLTAGSQGYASDTHAPGWLIDDTWSWLDITKGKTLTVTGSPTLAGDATLTLTTALTNNTGAGVLTWPAVGATLTIPATGTAALGTGTANYLSKWSDSNSITNSLIRDDGTTIGIGAAPAAEYFKVYKSFSSAGIVYGSLIDIYNSGGGDIVGMRLVSTILNASASNLYVYWPSTRIYNTTVNDYTIGNQYCGFFQNIFNLTNTGDITISGTSYAAIIKSPSVSVSSSGAVSIATQKGLCIENQGTPGVGAATITNAIGLDIADQSGATTNIALRTYAGSVIFNNDLADAADFLLNGTTYALIQTDASDDELYLCNHASAKLSFHAATPVVQQVLATGAGNDADDIITFLQLIGLCKQA